MNRYIFLVLLIILILALLFYKSTHTTEINPFAESQRIAEARLAEITKDKPADVTYTLSEKPKDIGSGLHLWEFTFTPNKTPYPADGVARGSSIVIVVDQESQKVVNDFIR